MKSFMMNTYLALTFMVACLAAHGYGFALKETSNSLAVAQVKTELMTDMQGIVGDLEESTQLKKQVLVDSVKTVAKAKSTIANKVNENVNKIKSALLRGAEAAKKAELSAIKAVRQSSIGNYMSVKNAELKKAIDAISAKMNNHFEQKISTVKGTVTSQFSSAKNKVHADIAKKKQLLSVLKTPSETHTLPVPNQEKPIQLEVDNVTPAIAVRGRPLE